MTTLSKPQIELTIEPSQMIRSSANFTHFRILLIGRASAGKTTILRRLCDAPTKGGTDLRLIHEKVELSALDSSLKHANIDHEIVTEGYPGLIFHDSRGFEAGGDQELKLVQNFIKQRSKARNVVEQLHAIWYCIPASDSRPITAAERIFFNESGTGLVPVIVLWTKTESLDLDRILQLMKEGKSKSEAKEQAPQMAWADFEKSIFPQFDRFKYPPKAHVVLRNMHEPGANCGDLIAKTTATLSSEALHRLFLSTQQNNIEFCIEYGIKKIVNSTESALLKTFKENKGNWACFMVNTLAYFPQLLVSPRPS